MIHVYQNFQRDGKKVTKEELELAMKNKTTGKLSPTILCFENADHGTTFGGLSASQINPHMKFDVPSFPWPVAPFPKYKFPLDENLFHNKCQDQKCLAAVEELIEKREATGFYYMFCCKHNVAIFFFQIHPLSV